MRISDWSSDGCSSDLTSWKRHRPTPPPYLPGSIITWEAGWGSGPAPRSDSATLNPQHQEARAFSILPGSRGGSPVGSASICSLPAVTSPHTVYWPSRTPASSKKLKQTRKSDVTGTSFTDRVDLGLHRSITKKK